MMKKLLVLISLAILLIACQPAGPAPGADLVGNWTNVGSGTVAITRLNIQPDGDSLLVEVWGSCTPTDCYWNGEYPGLMITISNITETGLTAAFDFGFTIDTLTIELLPDGRLRVMNYDSNLDLTVIDYFTRSD